MDGHHHDEDDGSRYIIPPCSKLLRSFVCCSRYDYIQMLRTLLDARPDMLSCVDQDDVLVKLTKFKKYDALVMVLERWNDDERFWRASIDFMEPVLYELILQMIDDHTSSRNKDKNDDEEYEYSTKKRNQVNSLIRTCLRSSRTPVSERFLTAVIESSHAVPDDIILLLEHPSVTPEAKESSRIVAATCVENSCFVNIARTLGVRVTVVMF